MDLLGTTWIYLELLGTTWNYLDLLGTIGTILFFRKFNNILLFYIMPTICDLKVELKSKGIKGYAGMNKSQLQSLLKTGKATPKTQPKPQPKPIAPKLLKFKEEEKNNNLKDKSYIFLKRKFEKIKNIIDNDASTDAEKKQAKSLIKKYEDAMILAKQKQYNKKKK